MNLIFIILASWSLQAFTCSCSSYSSFVLGIESYKQNMNDLIIAEFESLRTHENYGSVVKVVNVISGDIKKDEEIIIWGDSGITCRGGFPKTGKWIGAVHKIKHAFTEIEKNGYEPLSCSVASLISKDGSIIGNLLDSSKSVQVSKSQFEKILETPSKFITTHGQCHLTTKYNNYKTKKKNFTKQSISFSTTKSNSISIEYKTYEGLSRVLTGKIQNTLPQSLSPKYSYSFHSDDFKSLQGISQGDIFLNPQMIKTEDGGYWSLNIECITKFKASEIR